MIQAVETGVCMANGSPALLEIADMVFPAVTENGIYSVKGIQQQAFTACSQLKKIEIPNSVTDIAKGVFSECRNLSSISVIPAEYRIQKNGKTAPPPLTSPPGHVTLIL